MCFTKSLNVPIRFQEYVKISYNYDDNPFIKVDGTFFWTNSLFSNFSKMLGRKEIAFATSSKERFNASRVLAKFIPKGDFSCFGLFDNCIHRHKNKK